VKVVPVLKVAELKNKIVIELIAAVLLHKPIDPSTQTLELPERHRMLLKVVVFE